MTLRTAFSASPLGSEQYVFFFFVVIPTWASQARINSREFFWIISVFLTRRHQLWEASHSSVHSFITRWVTLDPTSLKVLFHDCATWLHTRFVAFSENFVIRRYNISKCWWMMNTVPSRFQAIYARRSCSFFVRLQTSPSRSSGTCVRTLCLPVGLLVHGLLDLSAIEGSSVDSSSELRPSVKVATTLEHCATGFLVPR